MYAPQRDSEHACLDFVHAVDCRDSLRVRGQCRSRFVKVAQLCCANLPFTCLHVMLIISAYLFASSVPACFPGQDGATRRPMAPLPDLASAGSVSFKDSPAE